MLRARGRASSDAAARPCPCRGRAGSYRARAAHADGSRDVAPNGRDSAAPLRRPPRRSRSTPASRSSTEMSRSPDRRGWARAASSRRCSRYRSARRRVIGVIVLDDSGQDVFSADDVRLAAAAAGTSRPRSSRRGSATSGSAPARARRRSARSSRRARGRFPCDEAGRGAAHGHARGARGREATTPLCATTRTGRHVLTVGRTASSSALREHVGSSPAPNSAPGASPPRQPGRSSSRTPRQPV